jgi:hypothetical protein
MMAVLPVIEAVLAVARPVLDRFFPDPKARQEFELAMRAADWQLVQAQLEINKVEAAHPSRFVSGWRPFIGWVGGFGLAWQFVLAPMLAWFLSIVSPGIPLPVIDSSGELLALVTALLGIGAMRSYDKQKGTSK